MYKTHALLCLFFALAGFIACSTPRGNQKQVPDFEKFPAVVTQTENKLLDVALSMPQQMLLYKDSLLLVANNLNTNPHHVRVFDIRRKKAAANILPASQHKGGTLSFMSFGISDSLVWVFDVAKNGFIVANLDTLLNSNGSLAYYSEYRIKPQVFYYDALLLNRNEALLSGNYDTDEKLVYLNFRDNTLNKTILSYQQDARIGSAMVQKMSYESFMMLKPDKTKVILACRYADQFEVLDLASGAHKKVSGPVGFPPQLAPFINNSGLTVATPDEKTRYGFLKGHTTENYFYLLFSGYPVKGSHQFYGNKIVVFDWNGAPVKQINLKKDIVDFAVTADNKTLYTLNPLTKTISVSELTW